MAEIIIEAFGQTPLEDQRIEIVERKGGGHPDSICDGIMEQVSLALCREYLSTFGRILHHNIDKGLLVAGRTEPRPGGGRVLEPMCLVFGDRATAEYGGKKIDIRAVAEKSAKEWLRSHLRFVDPEKHMRYQVELKEGSPELTDLFERGTIGANDTSAAVGYAPLTETERMVLAGEHYLNSPAFKEMFPEAGEDVKVMGYRRDRELILTIAVAFVDRFVQNSAAYFDRKRDISLSIQQYLQSRQKTLDRISVVLNALDDPDRGERGMYLTVLGTSAEGGDCGQVGRGNKVNGVIALNRPLGTEAAAGKNPVSHVGKIYTLLTHRMASQVYVKVPGLREVYVWLCSQIGRPIDQPMIASAHLILQQGVELADVEEAVTQSLSEELAAIEQFTARLARGELPVW
ncbi:MAG: methionine adenosyltransferase [Desulforhabdus sp.]|nr:methionine adenosyltransferase [Desulforhabdus sp.]